MNIPAADLARLNDCRHHDPHGFYGWHEGTVRTRQPGATAVHVHTPTQSISMDLVDDDIWEAEVGDNCDYRLEISYPEVPTRIVADGYHFLPTIGSLDLHLIGEGRHERLWEVLGANLRSYETEMGSVEGVSFAVWAPNAQGVAVVGDFCGWNPTQYPMRSLGSTGVWEVFVPGIGAGEHYKFALFSHEGRKDKADPLAKRTACPPETDSIVDSTSFAWSDSAWMGKRTGNLDVPMSIYEVHVGSWKVGANYNRLREELIPYLKEHGFTHVCLLYTSPSPRD